MDRTDTFATPLKSPYFSVRKDEFPVAKMKIAETPGTMPIIGRNEILPARFRKI